MKSLFLSLIVWASPAFAAPLCFKDLASYEAVKSQLPPSMRKGSLVLAHESNKLTAVVRLVPAGGKFRFEMAYDHWLLGNREDSGQIKEICVSGSEAVVKLASGSSKKLKISGGGFTYEGFALKTANSSKFSSLMKTIKGASKNEGGGSGQK